MIPTLLAILTLTPFQSARQTLLLAHYMPWFQNKETSGKWGWHWTMGHFNPERTVNGRQDAASAFRPLMGLYDSSDPDVVEYQVALMKVAGLDGALVDWYGDQDTYDYLSNDHNTDVVFQELDRAGLKHALVYEDQTVTQLIKTGKITAEGAVENGKALMERTQARWFRDPGYATIDGRPLLLCFGPQYYKDADWSTILGDLKPTPAFFSLMSKRGGAVGAFAWPTPQRGEETSWKELDMFSDRAKDWPYRINVAYPRFKDVYKEAGVQPGFPEITDRGGQTFRDTFLRALATSPRVIQIATWNDWGEGTQVEPSVEYGYRDLEAIQEVRRKLTHGFVYSAEDLRIPAKLLSLRKSKKADVRSQASLDRAFKLLVGGKPKAASALLDGI